MLTLLDPHCGSMLLSYRESSIRSTVETFDSSQTLFVHLSDLFSCDHRMDQKDVVPGPHGTLEPLFEQARHMLCVCGCII